MDVTDLASIWETEDGKKSDLITRSEQYAVWTVPSICPEDVSEGATQRKGNVAIGARLVNHLANRIVDTMFPNDRPFFSLPLTPEAEQKIETELNEEQRGVYARQILKVTSAAENKAMRKLRLTEYRPVAVQTVQHLIVTGNAVILRDDKNDKRVVYGVKDFCIVRDVQGMTQKCILRDLKLFGSLPQRLQEILRANTQEQYKDDTKVTLYTLFWLEDGRWHRIQGIDKVAIESTRKSYADVDLPILPLTWNLSRGHNYGRGLVEDNAVQFHNVDSVTAAMIDLIGVAADMKFLVSPSSQTDITEWNQAKRGAYLVGNKDDVTCPDFPKRLEMEFMRAAIQQWEQELSRAFLLNTSAVRDAERVTAEEIRFVARELESAFGGLYSTLALGWQAKEAEYLISKIDFSVMGPNGIIAFDVTVTTGLESLSREGQLDQLRLAIADLAMLDAVPEDFRAVIDKRAFAEFIFTNRGVNLAQFILTEEQLEAQRKAEQARQQAEIDAAAGAQAGVAAAKVAAQEGA